MTAFGLNRSEQHRSRLADVLGIEATGIVAACADGEFELGQCVIAMMGGLGRVFDQGRWRLKGR